MNCLIQTPKKFCGPAVAIAGFATTALVKAHCWHESIIDQIVDDGDTYYTESYDNLISDDRKILTVVDLKKDFVIQKTHRVYITIDDPTYAGKFRSNDPTDLHLVKALELFFQRYNAGVLTSLKLNIAIWRDSEYFYIFDGQGRKENLTPTDEMTNGSAKLIIVRDLARVLFIILEKSGIGNEHFLLCGLAIQGLERIPLVTDDPDEPQKSLGRPHRRPSGYEIQEKFRAMVRGSFHILHNFIPEELRGHGHLIIALAALIYSRLINANKWTTAMIDLILNQSNIYLVDLARVLEKKLDATFDLKIDDVVGDVILGVYAAKVNVRVNVVPGQAKKGKATINSGLRDFFNMTNYGILEIKKYFYAVWKDRGKFYFLDPFPCDEQGFRVDSADPENLGKYNKAVACVTMNSSIDQLIETILENTGNKEKDPFILHGFRLLYVKTGSIPGGPLDTLVFREKKTNRRPVVNSAQPQAQSDNCSVILDMIPRPRSDAEKTKDFVTQYPNLMKSVEEFMMKNDEPSSFVDAQPLQPLQLPQPQIHEAKAPLIFEEKIKFIKGYKIVNSHRLILHGSKNCLDADFEQVLRGRQGAALALTAIAYAKIKDPMSWRNLDVDQILRVGNEAHEKIVAWIRQGSPAEVDAGEQDNEEDEDEDEDEEDNDVQLLKTFKKVLKPMPSHLEVSMLPGKIKLGENEIKLAKKICITEGNADPLVNLGEALEHCLQKHSEFILENNKLMYGIWSQDDKYFVMNPYGNDENGWRLRHYPASLIVMNTINEITNLFHGLLEFNNRVFFFHLIGIESIQPGNKYMAPVMQIPEAETLPKYLTKFLPITDDDLFVSDTQGIVEQVQKSNEGKGTADDDDDDDDDDDNNDPDNDDDNDDDHDEEDEEHEKKAPDEDNVAKPFVDFDKPLEDPFLEVKEQEHSDAPDELNLSLLTDTVKFEEYELLEDESLETRMYERLKYSHPPPYVLPPEKVLCVLLNTKKAFKSDHSLISRFSVDSKLAVKSAMDVESGRGTNEPAIATVVASSPIGEGTKLSEMIKLPPKKYLFSRIPLLGITPLRAIDDKFIQDEDLNRATKEYCKANKIKKPEDLVLQEIAETKIGIHIAPEIIPLGPSIKTPSLQKKSKPCSDHPQNRKCKISMSDRADKELGKIYCNTENVLLEIIFPHNRISQAKEASPEKRNSINSGKAKPIVRIKTLDNNDKSKSELSETLGFLVTHDEDVGIIGANTCLEERNRVEECHYKPCFFAAILMILCKVRMDVNYIRPSILDQLIVASSEIHRVTGKLRYKPLRRFYNVVILGAKYNVILKQSLYAKPESTEMDDLSIILESYLKKNSTGILVFGNASYAFWYSNHRFYLFDSYACDERGRANETGYSCLLEFHTLDDMIKRIRENNGSPKEEPYRIYSLSIAHVETVIKKRKGRIPRKLSGKLDQQVVEDAEKAVTKEEEKESHAEKSDSLERTKKSSLIELPTWVTKDDEPLTKCEETLVEGFAAMKNFSASTFKVSVVENDITRGLLAPFKNLQVTKTKVRQSGDDTPESTRRKLHDRKFHQQMSLCEPLDLCMLAWSCVHNPTLWGVRTMRGIYEASIDLTHDSLLAAQDTTVVNITDRVLPEFSIANYSFRAVFAPLHRGTLYVSEGWNLAMSLKKLFQFPIYTGATLICGTSHIGIMKKDSNYYAWWTVPKTKNLEIITSQVFEDFLKLLVKIIGENERKMFVMRIVTISYTKILDPDCSDIDGLHETVIPATSLAMIHKKSSGRYDIRAIFRQTMPISDKPVFVLGSVALRDRDSVREPKVKRCYFVAILSVMVKRDVIQSPMPEMIDKVIQVAENLYKKFTEAKYHTEHILRNVTVMNRIFDFKDCASALFVLKENPNTGKSDFYSLVRKELKKHFKRFTHGLIQFTNCCYGFWYSRLTKAYYYLDPYQCNSNGRRVDNQGHGCLYIFSSLCQMARQMYLNRFKDTTGFFIHRLHVESINVSCFDEFKEDPMWVYLDYHWSLSHSLDMTKTSSERKRRRTTLNKKQRDLEKDICKDESAKKDSTKLSLNYYAIEVPGLIYSVWGTIGCYDTIFGNRAGYNSRAISVAILAMQYLCHPSRWGAAILDSAVICGDYYYTESLKSVTPSGFEYSNRFNLQPTFKVFPHVWHIEFLDDTCGVLYGGRERANLAKSLESALGVSSSIVLECASVTLAILSAEDAFYVADPCWTGPPVFPINRGAVYALRCRTINSLIYAVTKILNTNQRLEFHLTPIMFHFSHETCSEFAPDRVRRRNNEQKEILRRAFGRRPGKADGLDIPVPGAVTVPGQDFYMDYHDNLRTESLHLRELENPEITLQVPWMKHDYVNNSVLSTRCHLNMAQAPLKSNESSSSLIPFDPSANDDKLEICNHYPMIVDFASGKSNEISTRILTRKKVRSEEPFSKQLDCISARSFLLKSSRREFNKSTREMAQEAYKHRVDLDAVDIDREETLQVESAIPSTTQILSEAEDNVDNINE